MAVCADPSTFEFACNWLVSSETYCRDAMGATAVDLDTMRAEALARIHSEEAFDEADEDDSGETAPDDPSPVDALPRTIIRTQSYETRRVGIGAFSAQGTLEVNLEVLVPDAHRINYADDDAATKAAKFKARKEWARQLWTTIRNELLRTIAQGDTQGNPYLNATGVNGLPPADPDPLEGGDRANWMGFTFEVPWRG